MLIAISGAHGVGKTTLAAALAEALPGHIVIDEPYYLMEDSGHVFEDMPAVEDFEAQLEWSLDSIENGGADAILDRCPADFVAYVAELSAASVNVAADHWKRVAAAMEVLDLIVYIPIERPDRIHVADDEHPRLRRRVDRRLRQLIMEDELGVSHRAVEVRGSVSDRVASVLRHLETMQV